METNQIKEFAIRFFENLNCKISQQENVLVVENVPENFEKFFGKKSPYRLVFEKEHQTENTELIVQGNFLLKAMNDYLEDRGKTTLLEIDLDVKASKIIEQAFKLQNCKISQIREKKKKKGFFRFTFMTSFQYQNSKKSLTTEIFVRNNEIFNFNSKKYLFIEGKKRDLEIEGIEEAYNLSKLNLREVLNPKIETLKRSLGRRLEKDLERVRKHYVQQRDELESALNKNKEKLAELKQKQETENSEAIAQKIERLNVLISKSDVSEEIEKINKEEQFVIQDEVQKHNLNIKNKLINTSFIYYPEYSLSIFLEENSTSKPAGRMLDLVYDPLEKKLSALHCDSCGKELSELILCESGHLTCRECGSRCEACNRVICKKCSSKKCEECGKTICSKCQARCSRCGKIKCKSHMQQTKFGANICSKCLERCFSCGTLVDPREMVLDKETDQRICDKCQNKIAKRNTIKNIFGER